MPIITRRQLTSFYGTLEAGELLHRIRREEIALDAADRYLEFAETITRGQFLCTALELGLNRLKSFKRKMNLQTYELMKRYVNELSEGSLSEFQERVHINDILRVYDDMIRLYRKSGVFIDEPGFMLTRLIASGFKQLRDARKRKNIGSIAFAVDLINNLYHSEGRLTMWLDEDIDKRYATYTLTLVSASVYQPEALAHIYRDVRVALRRKALFHRASGVFDPYDRQQFLYNFVGRLNLLDEFTAEAALEEIDSLTLIKELLPRVKGRLKELLNERIKKWFG